MVIVIGGYGLFCAYFGNACIICYKNSINPSMLESFMKFIQNYAR